MSVISSVTKFVKSVPKNQFVMTAIVIVIVSLAIWGAIYYTHHEVINEKFADIVADIKGACNGDSEYPEIFQTNEYAGDFEKCDFCADSALI
jgi:hypothetical protein